MGYPQFLEVFFFMLADLDTVNERSFNISLYRKVIPVTVILPVADIWQLN